MTEVTDVSNYVAVTERFCRRARIILQP